MLSDLSLEKKHIHTTYDILEILQGYSLKEVKCILSFLDTQIDLIYRDGLSKEAYKKDKKLFAESTIIELGIK